jgi:hypothetical protein
MATSPTAVVTDIMDIQDDPANPGVNIVLTIVTKLLFMGPLPQEEQISVIVPNTSTKAQLKAAVDNAIIASAAAKGYALIVARILTVADIAG